MAGAAFIPGLTRSPLRTGSTTSFTSTSFAPVRNFAHTPRRNRSEIRMIAPEVARNVIAVYGIVVAGGGIGAFLRSGSKPSVISGVAAGIVLAAAYVKDSVPIALGTAIALAAVFAIRLAKTKKFMPAGMLCIVSVAAAAFFAASIYA